MSVSSVSDPQHQRLRFVTMRPLLPDTDVRASYLDLRARVIGLLDELDDSDGDRRVPGCPAWTVRNLVGHLLGVPEDVLAGNMAGVTTEAWTQAHADRHASDSMAVLRATLAGQAEQFDPVLAVIPSPVNSQFVMDAVTHEHDLREAIDRPGAHDSAAVHVALAWLLARPAVSDDLYEQLRSSPATAFVVMRALTGRMSVAEMNDANLPVKEIVESQQGTPFIPPHR